MTIAKQIYELMFGEDGENKTFESWYVPMIQEWLDKQENVGKPLDDLVREFNKYLDQCEAEAEGADEP